MNKSKLQVIASGCAFVLSVFLLVSATVAYFSDEVQITNTMTAGNVVIELTEAAVKREQGNLVENPLAPRIKGAEEATVRSYGTIYPGISIFKDPTIQNVGESDAWIAAKITFNDGAGDLSKLIGYDGAPGIDMRMLLCGGILEEAFRFGTWNGIENVRYNNRCAIVQKVDATLGQYEFYIFFHEPFQKDEQVVLFDHFVVPDDWSNQQMQELKELTINIQAYGVQLFDMDSCYEAMTKAFATQFQSE